MTPAETLERVRVLMVTLNEAASELSTLYGRLWRSIDSADPVQASGMREHAWTAERERDYWREQARFYARFCGLEAAETMSREQRDWGAA